MDICKNCGALIPEGAKFCPECGTVNDLANMAQSGQIKQEGYIPHSWMEDNGSAGNTGSYNTDAQSGNYNTGTQPGGSYQSSYTPPVTPPPGNTGKGGKKKNPAIFVFGFLGLLLVVLVAVLIGGSGSKSKADPNLGLYECVSREALGIDIGGGDDWVELKSGGKLTIYMTDEEYDGKWTLDGEDIEITQAGDTFSGTLEDGVLVIDFNDLICTYLKDGAEVPDDIGSNSAAPAPAPQAPAEAPAPAIEETVDYGWWEGDWYGWWIMNNATGDYTDLEDSCWDCCATISAESDGTGYIQIWDTDNDPDKCFALSDLEFVTGSGTMGCLVSVDGMMYDDTISYYEWYVDPVGSYTAEYENMIAFEGTYVNPEDSSSTFEYFIFMRPWGTDWEDVRSDPDNPNMPYTDMMPLLYDSWYAQHRYGQMPEYFDLE